MKERFDLVVRNGLVVRRGAVVGADLAIRHGRFAAIVPPGGLGSPGTSAEVELDASGLHVLPGVIDGHVHFREPGLTAKEDWSSGSLAAVMGGVTTVIDMPNTVPPTATASEVARKASIIDARSWCDGGVFGLAAHGPVDRIAAMAAAGVLGFKVFLGTTVGEIPPPDDAALEAAMRAVARTGLRLAVHAEDDAIIATESARLRAAGRSDPLTHMNARPVRAEVAAIERAARLAHATGVRLHILHLSSADGLDVVERWRIRGVDLTCELAPHHAFLEAADMVRLGSLARVNPPLRERGHGAALMAALASGRITGIASDHAPHEAWLKREPDIWRAASGFAGVETSLRLFLEFGVHAGRLSLPELVRATSEAPARTWGLWPRKGAIELGADADLALVDLGREAVIRAADGHSRNPLGPWEGVLTRGVAVATVLRGSMVMRDGGAVGKPHGEFARPIV